MMTGCLDLRVRPKRPILKCCVSWSQGRRSVIGKRRSRFSGGDGSGVEQSKLVSRTSVRSLIFVLVPVLFTS